jgi:hypothetical protein
MVILLQNVLNECETACVLRFSAASRPVFSKSRAAPLDLKMRRQPFPHLSEKGEKRMLSPDAQSGELPRRARPRVRRGQDCLSILFCQAPAVFQ